MSAVTKLKRHTYIMQVTESVDVEYVGKTRCKAEVLEEAGEEMPRITLDAKVNELSGSAVCNYIRKGRTQLGRCLDEIMRPKSGRPMTLEGHTKRRRHGSNEGSHWGCEEGQDHLSGSLLLPK